MIFAAISSLELGHAFGRRIIDGWLRELPFQVSCIPAVSGASHKAQSGIGRCRVQMFILTNISFQFKFNPYRPAKVPVAPTPFVIVPPIVLSIRNIHKKHYSGFLLWSLPGTTLNNFPLARVSIVGTTPQTSESSVCHAWMNRVGDRCAGWMENMDNANTTQQHTYARDRLRTRHIANKNGIINSRSLQPNGVLQDLMMTMTMMSSNHSVRCSFNLGGSGALF